ncbi:GGDEF domain-containing protein [Hydrogenophaga aquatica]
MHSWTLLLASTIMLGCVNGLAVAVWFFNRHIPGLLAWIAAFSCAFLASLNYLVRPHLQETFALVSITVLTLGTAYFNVHACRQHLGLKIWRLRYGTVALLVAGVLVWSVETLRTNLPLRFLLLSLISGGLFLYAGRLLTRAGHHGQTFRHLFGWTCTVHGLLQMLRPVLLLWNTGAPGSYEEALDRALPIMVETLVAMQIMSFGVLMLVNEHLRTELVRLAQMDPLTDVFNRRSFLTLLDKAVSQAQRRRASVPLLLIDLDHFKTINDTHGHFQGDNALRHFVEVTQSVIRHQDVLGRLGGEEFAVFLPETGLAEAADVAERLREAVAASVLEVQGHRIPLTASIGVAECREHGDIEAALHRADEAMYRAKAQGRNRVVLAPVTA